MDFYVWRDVMGAHVAVAKEAPNVQGDLVPERLWEAYVYKILAGHLISLRGGVPPITVEVTAEFVTGRIPTGIRWGVFLPSVEEMTEEEKQAMVRLDLR